MRAIVYAPEGSARAKLDLIERHGGEIRAFGADFDLAKDEAKRVAAADGVPFFADGAEEAQYGGYAEIADEVLDQLGRAPGAIVVPVGNGALLGGIGLRLAEWAPGTLRIGVVASAAPVMAESWEAGRLVEAGALPTIADGLAVAWRSPTRSTCWRAQPSECCAWTSANWHLPSGRWARPASGSRRPGRRPSRPCRRSRPSTARWC